ncbi:MAG: hypothetical protein EXR62_15720 [Chloroflexi bacterium]|nr:hypothetical protein [Chloroflexota bacterium]
MRYPWANIVLLGLLLAQLLTGLGGLMSGSPSFSWVLWLHGIGAYAVVVVFFWKSAIIYRVFQRRKAIHVARLGFWTMALVLLAIVATGYFWTYAGAAYLGNSSLMVVHGLLAGGLVAFLAWHVLAKRFIFRFPQARDRRAFLRLAGMTLAGWALWRLAEPVRAAVDSPGVRRRFTGSYENGSLTGAFPEVSWLFDGPPPMAAQDWRLVIDGAVDRPLTLSYAQVQQLAVDTIAEILDCTGGWYSRQAWTGVAVGRLLQMAGVQPQARSVTVAAVSGYGRRFNLAEISDYILATQVGGQPLIHGHGFPARLVANGHRGYDWVKWVTHIQVNTTSQFLQPPLPLQ